MSRSNFYGRDTNSIAPYKKNQPQVKENQDKKGFVNLGRLDIHELTRELIAKYNQNNDTGIIKSFFRKKNFQGQDKALEALLDLTGTIRRHSGSLIEYKAHLATQQEVFEIIAEGKITEAKLMAAKTRARMEADVFRQQLDKEKAQAELDSLIIENNRAKSEAEKVQYEAEEKKQRARLLQLRGDLFKKVTQELDFANIDMKQVLVLIEMVKDGSTPENVVVAEAKWEQLKAEAKKSNALADQEETEAEWKKFRFQEESKPPNDV